MRKVCPNGQIDAVILQIVSYEPFVFRAFLGKRVSVSVTITSALAIVSDAEDPARFGSRSEMGPPLPLPPPDPPCCPCSGREALFLTAKCELFEELLGGVLHERPLNIWTESWLLHNMVLHYVLLHTRSDYYTRCKGRI